MGRAKAELPTLDILNELLICDSVAGRLFWKHRAWAKRGFNEKMAGREAGHLQKKDGRVTIRVLGGAFFRHRVIWYMTTGVDPGDLDIDHEDHNPGNDAFSNLRLASHSGNHKNRAPDKRNTSGVMGVRFDKRRGKWLAQIGLDMGCVFLGRYATKEEAVAARMAAELKFGFHPNHGRVAHG